MKGSVADEKVAAGPQISKQQRTRDSSKATNLLSKDTYSPLSTATKHILQVPQKVGGGMGVEEPEVTSPLPFSVHPVSIESSCILHPEN